MRHALRNDIKTATERERKQRHLKDGSVLDGEALLAYLEADLEPDHGGDPIKGIAIAVLIGAALWIALAAALVLLW